LPEPRRQQTRQASAPIPTSPSSAAHQNDPEDENAVTNPTLLVEVTSPSTGSYDRGEKFAHYQRIASLQQFVVVSHRERSVDVWTREDAGGWQQRTFRDGQRAELGSIGSVLDVAALYEGLALRFCAIVFLTPEPATPFRTPVGRHNVA